MANIIARYKKGKMTVNLVEGDFQGKKTYSYTINKSILKDGKWTSSDFLGITDMQDLLSLAMAICSKYVKFEKTTPKQDTPQQETYEPEDDKVPF